jgi:two-component system OmpR family response regulator
VAKLLLVEDDTDIAASVRDALHAAGHEADIASDGKAGLALALSGAHAALILDRMLPELDGLSIAKQVRAQGSETPILFLTAMSGIADRVEGLEGGGDDYLVKPFAITELLARVNVMIRRSDPERGRGVTKMAIGGLEMDLIRRTVHRDRKEIGLQAQEFKLLEYLMRNAGRIVTRTMLLENVWNLHFDPRTNIVETHMSRLRAKVDRGYSFDFIRTVRGVGYTLRAG